MSQTTVPSTLRTWFVVHFVADYLFAIPLLIAPIATLELFGWESIDPISARLVGAALVAIGGESLLGRNGSLKSFQTMLRMKVIWSATAVLGILASMLQGGPPLGWGALAVFVGFNGVWTYYYLKHRAS